METSLLPASTLRTLAKTLAAEARRLERAAESRERDLQAERQHARLRSIPGEIERLANRGMTREAAAAVVAHALDVPLATALAHERRDRAGARRRELLRLFERGLGDAEIGQRLGMHPKSVARAIQRARRAAPLHRQP